MRFTVLKNILYIVFIGQASIMYLSDEQMLNANDLIKITDEGIDICVDDEHSKKCLLLLKLQKKEL